MTVPTASYPRRAYQSCAAICHLVSPFQYKISCKDRGTYLGKLAKVRHGNLLVQRIVPVDSVEQEVLGIQRLARGHVLGYGHGRAADAQTLQGARDVETLDPEGILGGERQAVLGGGRVLVVQGDVADGEDGGQGGLDGDAAEGLACVGQRVLLLGNC